MKILGSVYFAIFLIVATIIFVIGGTFLESWSGSHLFAARFSYHNPFFITLLWLYFVNILCSTIRRYPFRKKHIPFLITHTGLLMILGGTLIKSHYGLQGMLVCLEGEGTKYMALARSYALHVEDRDGHSILPLHNKRTAIYPTCRGLDITLLEWNPHSIDKIEGFIKDKLVHLIGFPPFYVDDEKPLRTTHYDLFARCTNHTEKILFPGRASLFFVQDDDNNESLVAFNAFGKRHEQKISRDVYYIFDKGFSGYGLSVDLPADFPEIELITLLTYSSHKLPAHKKREELKPQVKLKVSNGKETEFLTLTYDASQKGFKWPILGGTYLIGFQPELKPLPFFIRLHQARAIFYPQTDQPYSYEADLEVDGVEKTISMNHVYEKNGYRLYLANLIIPDRGAKRAQIVVSYDPVKTLVTYPGGILLALGICLLYLQRRHVA